MRQAEAVLEWLRSSEGRAALDRAAHRAGVAYLRDDLAADVVYRTQVAETRGTEIDNVAAWTTHLLHRAAVDLLRGERRRPLPLDLPGENETRPGAEPVAGGDAIAEVVEAAAAVGIRRAVAARVLPVPWIGAAGLARLTYTLDGADVAQECPRPAGGAGDLEAADWAGLWYAGRDECFPAPGEVDGTTMRKRRARAAAKVRELLAEVARGELARRG